MTSIFTLRGHLSIQYGTSLITIWDIYLQYGTSTYAVCDIYLYSMGHKLFFISWWLVIRMLFLGDWWLGCLFPGDWWLAILFLGDWWLENLFLGDGDFGVVFPGRLFFYKIRSWDLTIFGLCPFCNIPVLTPLWHVEKVLLKCHKNVIFQGRKGIIAPVMFRNASSIVSWGFPMRVLMNCEERRIWWIALVIFKVGKVSFGSFSHTYVY